MRKSFDGLMAIIRDTYQLDPYANAVYLFCGRDSRKIKALYFDKTGFVLMQKRLDGTGRFQWRGMLLKQGFFPGRNSGGLWKAFPSTSQRQSGSVGGRKIFNLCAKQRFYKFSVLFQVKDNGHLSTVLFLQFLDLWMFPLQVRLWFFICG